MESLNLINYYYHDIWNENGDPRVTKYLFMDGGPFCTITLVCIYLYFVKSLGPKLMENRKPFNLKTPILIFNIMLVCLNSYGFINGFILTNYSLDAWKCITPNHQSQDPDDLKIIYLGWIYLISKFIDFGDSFFFVLRKKADHLSFLHVYHHACMPIYSWLFLKFVPGGNSTFAPLINAFVHIIMYTYYALSTFPSLRPYLWWKRYLTQLQLFQFVMIIIHSTYSILMPSCGWPKLFVYVAIVNAALFFYLFFKFFLKTYQTSTSTKLKKEVENQMELQIIDDKITN